MGRSTQGPAAKPRPRTGLARVFRGLGPWAAPRAWQRPDAGIPTPGPAAVQSELQAVNPASAGVLLSHAAQRSGPGRQAGQPCALLAAGASSPDLSGLAQAFSRPLLPFTLGQAGPLTSRRPLATRTPTFFFYFFLSVPTSSLRWFIQPSLHTHIYTHLRTLLVLVFPFRPLLEGSIRSSVGPFILQSGLAVPAAPLPGEKSSPVMSVLGKPTHFVTEALCISLNETPALHPWRPLFPQTPDRDPALV